MKALQNSIMGKNKSIIGWSLYSTISSVIITTWTCNGETLQHNTSYYTMLTEYGTDPINANHISSRLVFSHVTADNTRTYSYDQCGYD